MVDGRLQVVVAPVVISGTAAGHAYSGIDILLGVGALILLVAVVGMPLWLAPMARHASRDVPRMEIGDLIEASLPRWSQPDKKRLGARMKRRGRRL